MLFVQGCAGYGRNQREARSLTTANHIDQARKKVVMAALSQVGTPYVFGGEVPGEALDCSGLTRYAHSKIGLEIPRVSVDQRRAAKPLANKPPAPGDLVFFQINPRTHHVGIMVDEQRFVHASTSQRAVRLALLDNPYWQQRLLGSGTFLHDQMP